MNKKELRGMTIDLINELIYSGDHETSIKIIEEYLSKAYKRGYEGKQVHLKGELKELVERFHDLTKL